MKKSLLLLSAAALAFAAAALSDSNAVGTWQTESNGKGYLHVSVEPCADALCGTIVMAYDADDVANESYEHIGKKMIWGMKPGAESGWAGGKIWDPSGDKTYKSKMSVSGDTLSVSGCVLMFCRSQQWKRGE